MKIIYSAGNRYSSALQAFLFAKDCCHTLKIAAHEKSAFLLNNVDWNLDALNQTKSPDTKVNFLTKKIDSQYNYLYLPKLNGEFFISEVKEYDPDLIISDAEPILAKLAKELNKELWYYSPIHLYSNACFSQYSNLFKKYYYHSEQISNILKIYLPKANRTIANSAFCGIKPLRKATIKNIETVSSIPHHISEHKTIDTLVCTSNPARQVLLKQLFPQFIHNNIYNYDDTLELIYKSNYVITTGETDYLFHALHSMPKSILISPSLNDLDIESLINTQVSSVSSITNDIGQIELMSSGAEDWINFNKLPINYKKINNCNFTTINDLTGQAPSKLRLVGEQSHY